MTTNLTAIAVNTIKSEADSLLKMAEHINPDFEEVIKAIANSKGRLIITGIGKSAIIGQKIVATLNSTGTPSVFLHAAEAIHGDLGMVLKDDMVLCISKSGNSPEIKVLLPILKKFGNVLIGMTGNLDSFLAKESDFVLNVSVDQESCPNNLAPTNSTTAQLVMGDCIAVCLMHLNQFGSKDFAKYHPGGSLGKKLLFAVEDIFNGSQKPQVSPIHSIKEVIVEISEKRLGVTAVIENKKIVGIITDGDIRRMLEKFDNIKDIKAQDVMSKQPKTIHSKTNILEALRLMEDLKITQLVVADEGVYQGIIHLHDILKEGITK